MPSSVYIYIRYIHIHTHIERERENILETHPMIVANRSTLVEEILFNHSIKNVSKRQERYVHIIHSHLHIYIYQESVIANEKSRNPSRTQTYSLTLSSNCSMKRSTPLMLVAMFSCVKITPLGSPLVPLVYMIEHMLDGSGGDISTGFSLPCSEKNDENLDALLQHQHFQ